VVVGFAAECRADAFHRLEHCRIAEATRGVARSGNDDERDIGPDNGITHIECRAEAVSIFFDQFLELRLVDGCSAGIERLNKGPIHVDADDVESLAREHGGERRAELPETDDRNLHSSRTPPSRAEGAAHGT
jgi:hypothetical protein